MNQRPEYCCGACPAVESNTNHPDCEACRTGYDCTCRATPGGPMASDPTDLIREADADLDLWPRIEAAIKASVISRFDAEYCLPKCQAKRCKVVDPGQLDWLYKMFVDSVRDSVYKELLCKAVTEPDEGELR